MKYNGGGSNLHRRTVLTSSVGISMLALAGCSGEEGAGGGQATESNESAPENLNSSTDPSDNESDDSSENDTGDDTDTDNGSSDAKAGQSDNSTDTDTNESSEDDTDTDESSEESSSGESDDSSEQPSDGDYNCDDFDSQAEAQEEYEELSFARKVDEINHSRETS